MLKSSRQAKKHHEQYDNVTTLCKRNVIYIRQVRFKHLELTLGYMGKFFNNGSMATKFHILNSQEGLGGHAQDGRCASSRN